MTSKERLCMKGFWKAMHGALQRNLDLCIPRKGVERLSPYFCIHLSVSDLYIPTFGPPIFLQQNRQRD
jgi:hypothetical protein